MGFESEVPVGKSKMIVVILVVVGIAVLAIGAYVAFTHRSSGGEGVALAATAGESQWCALRKEWKTKSASVASDIAVAIAGGKADQQKALMSKRNTMCQEYAGELEKLLKTASKPILVVETALVKEGKVRANLSVEIHNLVAKHIQSPAIKLVRKALETLKGDLKARMAQKKAAFDKEVGAALAAVKGCTGIYRGPFTDAGTSASPYVSWTELDLKRQAAVKQLDARVKELEPMEQYGNQVHHELVRKYRKSLSKCYRRAKGRGGSAKLNLLITLKGNGGVGKLGLVGAQKADEKVLECLLSRAATWKLPAPVKPGDRVSIDIDFSRL